MRIVFCGVGALGSHAGWLCRNLPVEMSFVDFDRVESKNLLAQAFTKQALGRNKAEAMRLQLLNFYGVRATAFPVRIESTNVESLGEPAGLLVDCLDNLAGRQVLSTYARASSKPLVHAALSADGQFGLIRWDEHFVPDPEDVAGRATCEGGEHLPAIARIGAALAGIVQEFVELGLKRDVMVARSGITTTSLVDAGPSNPPDDLSRVRS